MVHSKETIEAVKKLRRQGISFSKIGKRLNLTKGQVLALFYRHVLCIDRHSNYKRKRKEGVAYVQEDKRPTVVFVPGLKDTIFYKLGGK